MPQAFLNLGDKINRTVINKDVSTFYEKQTRGKILFLAKGSSKMNKLWAPWRMDYIRTPKQDGCVFCIKHKSNEDKENLVLFRGKESFILMNLFPYTNGHIMISPYKHTSNTDHISSKGS